MPAFTFEKITHPMRHPAPSQSKPQSDRPRGALARLLDRFVALRVRHSLREERAAIPADKRKL